MRRQRVFQYAQQQLASVRCVLHYALFTRQSYEKYVSQQRRQLPPPPPAPLVHHSHHSLRPQQAATPHVVNVGSTPVVCPSLYRLVICWVAHLHSRFTIMDSHILQQTQTMQPPNTGLTQVALTWLTCSTNSTLNLSTHLHVSFIRMFIPHVRQTEYHIRLEGPEV
jgi:hypothetical protein